MQIFLTGKKSIFEEIVDSISSYIDSGILSEGDKLPSVRELALSLSINPNTVARAYDDLIEKKYVTSIPKKGVFVGAIKKSGTEEEFKTLAKKYMDNGLSKDKMIKLINEADGEDKK
ncbi:MAG: GntR family transcriptional regulator [Bacilli bacterium]|jgi:GntR family transcriptional regulator|nr:GntR family transcriptional regulator [Bacilli bacterium]MCH4228841.1 GntR family transcriptional regulator [Bacilli bacterium]MCH4278412.1 GntR family transcriptional regulator [Bacilli bacterium]MCI2054743.1 GntR family transcriptional regulator [Bacilli bacterium]